MLDEFEHDTLTFLSESEVVIVNETTSPPLLATVSDACAIAQGPAAVCRPDFAVTCERAWRSAERAGPGGALPHMFM